jgi:SUMO ligase MMS21 Smc5/6 complex component
MESDCVFYLILSNLIYLYLSETSNKSAIKNKNSKLSQYNSQVIKRRSETFAEAEFRMKSKNIEIGILGQVN